MNTQKNLMMLTIVISAIYGVWAIFAPGSIMSTYGTPEEFVKSENLYGLDLEERREIFKEVLPEEEFIDRRINIGELIEPETESDNEE